VYRVQHLARFIRYEDLQGDDIPSREDALREQFAGRKYRLGSRGLEIVELTAFRIGIEFVDIEKISRHTASGRPFGFSIFCLAKGCFVR